MRILSREAEGGFTVADWDDGFVALCRDETPKRVIGFQFERWPCCPGAFELNVELLGLMFVVYNDGGPCQLESFLDDLDEPEFEPAVPSAHAGPANGSDWRSVPSPAIR